MNAKLPLVVILGILVGGGSAYLIATTGSNGQLPAVPPATGTALIGGPFSLVDQSGKAVTDKTYAGKPMLVFFGFTNCPDVCPSGLQVMTAALDKLAAKADRLTPLFITVDPERDTPAKLAEYIKSFHPGITALSGPADNVAAAVKAYRVYAKKIPDEKTPGAYSIDHTSFFYVMDASGQYTKHFPHTIDAGKLASELEAVL
jgi:protein SCO1